jgi:transcriptional regulator with XRE-family HTH domain
MRAHRLRNGWTLADVAGLTGLDQSYISRLERGEKAAAAATKVRIARCLDATVADLFDPDVDGVAPKADQ